MQTFLIETSSILNQLSNLGEIAILSFINLLVVFIIVHFIYNSSEKTKDYEFSFLLIGSVVFFLCYMLGNVDLQLGFALGLFAIFGIIRYRTDAIPIKEMTYLFLVIAISVINALSNKELTELEIIFVNVAIIVITFTLEKAWKSSQLIKRRVTYERIENAKPENYERLIEDLQKKTGMNIFKVDIHDMDFLKDTVELTIYAYKNETIS